MTHGIAGPLALLSLGLRHSVTVDGQITAIERICQWLGTWRHDGDTGPWWPAQITDPALTLHTIMTGMSSGWETCLLIN